MEETVMKLNYKRTVLVGFAFFLICAFWQAYDSIIPKILTDKFGMNQTLSGFIMAFDNILALFMLPLFGSISDKSKHKRGKRSPFIIVGTIAAAASFLLLSFADLAQLKNIDAVSKFDDVATLETLYEHEYGKDHAVMTPDGTEFRVNDFDKDEWMSINSNTRYYVLSTKKLEIVKAADCEAIFDGTKMHYADGVSQDAASLMQSCRAVDPYIQYVVPARQAYAWDMTSSNSMPLIFFMILLILTLIAMAIFRSPAVALMPDITPKPLRSKGNAIINLMGSLGGVIVLVMGILLGTGKIQNQLMSYTLFMAIISGIMIMALVIFMSKVKEPEWAAEAQKLDGDVEVECGPEGGKGKRPLSSGERRSLILILASVALWYMGYNAISSKYSVYATSVLGMDYNTTIIVGQLAAIAAYLPASALSSKLGRKKTIMAGVAVLAFAAIAASFLTSSSSLVLMNVLFALFGIGWATINVNSFPMVVELARGGDVGKYTGFYYTASMAAQIATPVFSGYLMDQFGMRILFPYAAVFIAVAFVTMHFVRHGDSRPLPKKNALEVLGAADD